MKNMLTLCTATILFISNAFARPVEMLNFIVVPDQNYADVFWATISETTINYFVVEKSFNGAYFEEVAREKGTGNSRQTLNYKVTDKLPFNGTSYYRLKQTDSNGYITYSVVLKISMKDRSGGYFFSDPSGFKNTYVTLYGVKSQRTHTVVYDNKGNEVFSKLIVFKETGIMNFPVDQDKKLAKGIYCLIVTTGKKSHKQNLMIN